LIPRREIAGPAAGLSASRFIRDAVLIVKVSSLFKFHWQNIKVFKY
jgi:hypothetical protein